MAATVARTTGVPDERSDLLLANEADTVPPISDTLEKARRVN